MVDKMFKKFTAIRLPLHSSGIVVVCQNERSQRQNKDIAMKILMSRLLDLEQQKQNEKMDQLKGKHISKNGAIKLGELCFAPLPDGKRS